MELRHGGDSLADGIAQRYPLGPVWVNTPALQTNFGPVSAAFWRQAYLEMADVMTQADLNPYLQFGETQWWYKPDDGSGMPFYDDYTVDAFQQAYGRPPALILDENANPALYPAECLFFSSLIGEFTDSIIEFVRASFPDARFEVLYPVDVNNTALNRVINYPQAYWTAAKLTCIKTENFIYTGKRDLDKCREAIRFPYSIGFEPSRVSHLVGIGDFTTPWGRERVLALCERMESVVLFALDQLCLIGYKVPLKNSRRSAGFLGR